MNAKASAEPQTRQKNPYVGPRPFRSKEPLPNRQEEARELSDLVIAERVVLLHSPSGAGKTSLIQAAVVPMLERDGFRPVGPARVDKPRLSDGIRNRYVYSIAQFLLDGSRGDPGQLEQLTLGQVLDLYTAANLAVESDGPSAVADSTQPRVLILDQFEEILVLDPTDWTVKEQFFDDLREVIVKGPWWVLFAMREDFMGGLNPYLSRIPGHLRTTYRLDFLTPAEASAAIKVPAESKGVCFDIEAADLLIDKIARIQVDAPDEEPSWLRTPYVQPFQLQVACHQLWKQVRWDHRGRLFSVINCDDVQKLDVHQALGRYFSDTVTDVAQKTGILEGIIREWFEIELITVTLPRIRKQTRRIPAGNSDAVRLLQAAYLVDEESRGGTTWYELGHDGLVPAVINSNKDWRRITYKPWQISAYKWRMNNKPESLLLSRMELNYAPATWSRNLTPDEVEFLKKSRKAVKSDSWLSRHRDVTGAVTAIALIELALIVLLVLKVL
jgi:hypothetical protein